MARTCARCAGELRFSHREYAGRGASVEVRRCAACGELVRSTAAAREPRQVRRATRAPVDEGPPVNTVIDAETAERLRGLLPEG